MRSVGEFDFPFICEPDAVLTLWRERKFGKMRKVWQNIYGIIFKGSDIDKAGVTERLKNELLEARNIGQKEMDTLKITRPELNSEKYLFHVTFQALILSGGIADKHVLRFLLTSGFEEYAKNVPMAIFMKIKR